MRSRVARWIAKWRTEYAVAGLLLYVVFVFPVTIIIFPDSSLWLALLIAFDGLLGRIEDVADQFTSEGEEPSKTAQRRE